MRLRSPIRDDIRYGFAVGRIRVLEARLLSRSAFERLIDAPDFAEQRRVLSETAFGRYLEGATTAEDVERALDASLGDLYEEFVESSDLPEGVVRFFRLPHDYQNIRAALKARALDAPEPTPSALGAAAPAAPAERASGGYDDATGLVADDEDTSAGLDEIESAVDRGLFAQIEDAARRSGVRFLRDLVRLRIDLANIRVLLRANRRRIGGPAVALALVPGGSPRLVRLAADVARLSVEDLADAIVATRAVADLTEHDLLDLEHYDLVASTIDARRMAEARRIPNGPEPVVAYVLAREAEVAALRIVLIGRLAGVDREIVRERLRGVA